VRNAHEPIEGLTSRTDTVWVVSPSLREISGGLAPFGCPSGLRLRAWEPKGSYRMGWVLRLR
jgi:hypothetical protein